MVVHLAGEPPQSGWTMGSVSAGGQSASAVLAQWVGWISWFGIVLSGLALIGFAAMLAFDKERGRAMSATAPQIALAKIALGVLIISGAGALAASFFPG
ncbi:MAG: hypothetical protein SOW59_08470 [Corynebacterium sp.]|nr:hypothetical protein [Corynebacterium sp.]